MNLFSFIKQKISILEVVSEYTTLKKAGLYHKGCCPFHHERTPSFSVSPHKEIFYCFGCHIGGDAISFIAKIENCSQLDAAKHLIERYKIQLPDTLLKGEKLASHEDKKRYHELCALVAQWAYQQLQLNKIAQDYLFKRCVTTESIDKFLLGYFPSGPYALKKLLEQGKKQSFLAQDFIAAHIILEGKSGLYSPFEERILFPIKDHLGEYVGFGGRVFKSEDERAKYYNSHEHPFFNKGSLLFGLDKAKKSIQEKEAAFLVEGYMDVVMMVQHGYINTVATLGTACTLEHLKQLSRHTTSLYLLYDNDPAGQKAILRMLELCWHVNMDLFVVSLPDNHDPASYLEQGDLASCVNQAQDIFTFFIDATGTGFHAKPLQEKLSITKKVLQVIGHLEDPLKRDLLLQKASSIFAIPFETLKQQLSPLQPLPVEAPSVKVPELNEISQLEKKLFSAILYSKEDLVPDDIQLLHLWLSEPLKGWFERIIRARTQGEKSLDIFTDQEKSSISKLVMEGEEALTEQDLYNLLLQFYKKQWKIVVHNVKLRIKQAQLRHDTEAIEKLVSRLEKLKKKMLLRGIHE